jgi:sulfur carrier protein
MGIVQVNGKNQDLATPLALMEVMKANDVTQPEMVTVQVNGEFVNRDDFGSLLVQAGDEVDFLFFMGGGSRC